MHQIIEKGFDEGIQVSSDQSLTTPIREYMLKEAQLQYKDYYESDAEEGPFFEYMDNMSTRDKIRLIEVFQDFTIKQQTKRMASIPKRENNPELSVFANLALDLTDFRDRVQPMANDMALLDKSQKFQRDDPRDVKKAIKEGKNLTKEIEEAAK